MSKKTNPTLVGLFVCVALALAGVMIVMVGSGKLFRGTTSYVLYFSGDLYGLNVGSPVTSRGVKVGEVESVTIVYDHAEDTIRTPVRIFIRNDAFDSVNRPGGGGGLNEDTLRMHFERGLRARCETQSLLTGQLRIDLDYHPETEAVYRAPEDVDLLEIPTLPSRLQDFARMMRELPMEHIVRDVQTISSRLARFLESGRLDRVADELERALATWSANADPEKPGSVSAELVRTLQDLRETLTRLERSANPLLEDGRKVMRELNDAIKSFRSMVDYVDRHPEALLRGKGDAR